MKDKFRPIPVTIFLKDGNIINDEIWGSDKNRAIERVKELYPTAYRVTLSSGKPPIPEVKLSKYETTWRVIEEGLTA